MLLIGIGLAMAALQNLANGFSHRPGIGTVALSIGLAVAAIFALATAHDLRRYPASG